MKLLRKFTWILLDNHVIKDLVLEQREHLKCIAEEGEMRKQVFSNLLLCTIDTDAGL